MYEIIKNVITSGGYKLMEIQHKIKKLYVLGDLSEEQADELLNLAMAEASAEAERPDVMQMLQRLADRVSALEAAQNTAEGDNTDGIEAWVPWDGISNKYQFGALVAHVGKVWRSDYKGQNVWEPGVPGTEAMWVLVTPESEEG